MPFSSETNDGLTVTETGPFVIFADADNPRAWLRVDGNVLEPLDP